MKVSKTSLNSCFPHRNIPPPAFQLLGTRANPAQVNSRARAMPVITSRCFYPCWSHWTRRGGEKLRLKHPPPPPPGWVRGYPGCIHTLPPQGALRRPRAGAEGRERRNSHSRLFTNALFVGQGTRHKGMRRTRNTELTHTHFPYGNSSMWREVTPAGWESSVNTSQASNRKAWNETPRIIPSDPDAVQTRMHRAERGRFGLGAEHQAQRWG